MLELSAHKVKDLLPVRFIVKKINLYVILNEMRHKGGVGRAYL